VLRIEGPGADIVTVRRNSTSAFRIFSVTGGDVLLSGITITNGESRSSISADGLGGGIYNNGTLFIDQCVITRNAVINDFNAGRDVYGGGIYNLGELRVANSTIELNKAATYFPIEGTWAMGGGLYNKGTVVVLNSTFSENSASSSWDAAYGGAIDNGGNGKLTISLSTISKNRADTWWGGGGGIRNNGTLQMRNTIVAGNTVAFQTPDDLFGDLNTSGFNLIGSSKGGTGYVDTDLLDVDPMLGDLQNNGGSTPTIALLPGSPAIDAGDSTGAPQWDQRGPGFPRIVNGTIDIGAFEVQPAQTLGLPFAISVLVTADFSNEP
jgi:hypothetical protein